MENEKNLPKRKKLRIKQYDYSLSGAYFVTICIKDRKSILSEIFKSEKTDNIDDPVQRQTFENFDIPQIRLTEIGKIAEKYLLSSENIPVVKIDHYVIMPDHIHAVIFLDSNKYTKHDDRFSMEKTQNRGSANETLPHVISVFKRFCNKEAGENIFQRGYYEHIIRNKEDYEAAVKYIYENPINWYNSIFSEE